VALMTNWDYPLPFWYSYRARDGYVVIVALTDRQWNALGETIGRREFIEDPRFSNFVDRIRNAGECREKIQAWMATKTMDEAVEALSGAGVPCGAVNNIERIHHDPQLIAREMLAEVEHTRLGKIAVPGIPIKLGETPGSLDDAGPDLGEHTDQILSGLLGMTPGEIERLRTEGAV
jgi:CoA:oxalate CoA-transferase